MGPERKTHAAFSHIGTSSTLSCYVMWPYIAAEERYVDECHKKQVLSMGKRGEGRKLRVDVTIIGLLDRET